MLKILTTTIAATVFSSTAFAQNTHLVQADVVVVDTIRSSVSEQVPVRTCDTVQVPITETRRGNSSSGDALTGAIIGGVIGNQFGNGSGKDAMTVLGAILGADVANKRGSTYEVVTGYREEYQCYTQYITEQREVESAYRVTYTWNGLIGTVITDTKYQAGDEILVNITMN